MGHTNYSPNISKPLNMLNMLAKVSEKSIVEGNFIKAGCLHMRSLDNKFYHIHQVFGIRIRNMHVNVDWINHARVFTFSYLHPYYAPFNSMLDHMYSISHVCMIIITRDLLVLRCPNSKHSRKIISVYCT